MFNIPPGGHDIQAVGFKIHLSKRTEADGNLKMVLGKLGGIGGEVHPHDFASIGLAHLIEKDTAPTPNIDEAGSGLPESGFDRSREAIVIKELAHGIACGK
jgi:hypothetical protein